MKQFKDRPDIVEVVVQIRAESNLVGIEWDAPASNNNPIKNYNIYLCQHSFNTNLDPSMFNQKGQVNEK